MSEKVQKEEKGQLELAPDDVPLEESVEGAAERLLSEQAQRALDDLKAKFKEQHGEDLFDTEGEEGSFTLGYTQGVIAGREEILSQFAKLSELGEAMDAETEVSESESDEHSFNAL